MLSVLVLCQRKRPLVFLSCFGGTLSLLHIEGGSWEEANAGTGLSSLVVSCLTASNNLSWKATYQAFLESINNSFGRDTKSLPRACSESFNPRQLCCRRRSRIGTTVRRRVQQSVALVSGGGACGERSPAVSR